MGKKRPSPHCYSIKHPCFFQWLKDTSTKTNKEKVKVSTTAAVKRSSTVTYLLKRKGKLTAWRRTCPLPSSVFVTV